MEHVRMQFALVVLLVELYQPDSVWNVKTDDHLRILGLLALNG